MDISNPLEQFQLVPIVQFSLGDADLSFTNSAFFGFLSIGFFQKAQTDTCRSTLVELGVRVHRRVEETSEADAD